MLADLVPIILKTRIERRVIGRSESQRRYSQKKRKALNAYRREWRKRRATK